ncbi:hypothetical protein KFE25_005172 [Diacronema lutheri]|uniref:PPM-type phosphatase domain-containing protein n=2 Tax=Diacronema lutheri TaxID=2081491 RepID=A0A8J5X8B5_DIALT|nr:hypothetical protein KFE25_005172 [Diacronema lutheri]
MNEPWSRSSAAYGSFAQGSISACRPASLSQTMPAPRGGVGGASAAARGLGAHRGLQRMDSTHVASRFGGLARVGSLPTLPNHLRPRTSGPGAPRDAAEHGASGRGLGPLANRPLPSNHAPPSSPGAFAQSARRCSTGDGRPTSSCAGTGSAANGRGPFCAAFSGGAGASTGAGVGVGTGPASERPNKTLAHGVAPAQVGRGVAVVPPTDGVAPAPWGGRLSMPGAAAVAVADAAARAAAPPPRYAGAGAAGTAGARPALTFGGGETGAPGCASAAAPTADAAASPAGARRFKVDAAASTIQGSHPGKAANQDRFLIELADAPAGAVGRRAPVAVAGVFDGHGELGHRVSAFVTDKLRAELVGSADDAAAAAVATTAAACSGGVPPTLASAGARAATLSAAPASASGANLARRLAGSFERTNRALSASGIDVRHSGTTACTAQLAGDELIVANVGDSRAVIGRVDPAAPGGALIARDLSCDHKPDSEGEHRRITRSGGRVAPMHVPGHGFVGPARVWDRSQRFGLATSRAFGDTTHSVANGGQVIAEPDVTVHRLTKHDRYVILGTDGVWDQLSSHEAVTMAAKHGADLKAASAAIAREAKRRWELSGPIRDDITAVVMRIEPSVPTGAATPGAADGRPSTSAAHR